MAGWLAVEDQADMAPGYLDALAIWHDLSLPGDDSVTFGIDAGEAHPLDRKRSVKVERELAAARLADALR